ncbi:MAG: hypothetical protein LC108_01255 [Anaerolineales bacterium]|nr:hypothetical protein [Anaerolineales bacterium]
MDTDFLMLNIAMLCFCGMLLLVVGVFILGVVVRRDNAKKGIAPQDDKL